MQIPNNTFAILLNHNDGENLVRSVKSLIKFSSVKKIIVVDNGSTDNSIAQVKKINSSKVLIAYNYSNLGFARGCNVGFKMALAFGADSVINLNPDMKYDVDFVKTLSNVNADICGPVLKFKRSGHWIYDFGGKINPIFGRATHVEREKIAPPDVYMDRNDKIDYICGGAIFIKKHVFEKIGYFNENYFIYYEDADFSFTAKKAGFTIKTCLDVVLEHRLEIHKVTQNRNKLIWNLESNLKFINKWIPIQNRVFAYGYWLLLAIKSLV